MTRPDDVPEGTWEAARNVMLESPFAMEASDYFDATQELIARAILAAQAEERERCAREIEIFPVKGKTVESVAATAAEMKALAAAIRSKPSAPPQ